ncbi:hypothetical protein DSO06_05130 [Candidatus Nezhaarchaeota archaeon WYZ-LMO8]|nr:MAG: hypothetical protein DSO06_05130 [Candidatus Nezhaarchaeota archaeon WYZ-LMO8]TDA36643.1 MAG: hypothetical protein DSO05_02900 [Candidatus Nezhaarchaeota archaeon WYZ-LMO7]
MLMLDRRFVEQPKGCVGNKRMSLGTAEFLKFQGILIYHKGGRLFWLSDNVYILHHGLSRENLIED